MNPVNTRGSVSTAFICTTAAHLVTPNIRESYLLFPHAVIPQLVCHQKSG